MSYDAATKRATLDPRASLERGATYEAVASTGAKDIFGNALDQDPSRVGNQMKVWLVTIRN